MKKIVRLTESDLTRLVKRTINEMDKENILKGITQGKSARRRDYSAEDAIEELEDYVYSNVQLGKNQLLSDISIMADSAAEELSDEEYDKFMNYYDDLENQMELDMEDDDIPELDMEDDDIPKTKWRYSDDEEDDYEY